MKCSLPTLIVGAALLFGCGDPATTTPDALEGLERLLHAGPALVSEPATRRAALEDSLVDPSNGYSQLRLAKYGLGSTGWDALVVRNFEVRPTTVDDIGAFVDAPFRQSPGTYRRVFEPSQFEWSHDHLIELGRRAFHEYPLSSDVTLASAFVDDESADAVGLWRADGGRLGGMVRARTGDGTELFASTCSSCHASMLDGTLVDGRTNAAVDRGAMIRRYHGAAGSDWGPGRVDVTPDGQPNPTAITDLRAVSRQERLHWAATLYNSPEALAVRVETLMITSAGESARPPREVAVALAYYLWSLGEQEAEPDDSLPGATVFERECSTCHHADGSTAAPVDIAAIGTDSAVGLSPMRGTGQYRVPSLYRVGTRSQFLHGGEVKSLDALFSPARLADVPGHVYGTNLREDERDALIEYLATL